MPLIRRAADRLAVEGMKTRRDAQTRLETVGDELLNGPTVDAVAGSLADHRVFERIARPTIDALDVETVFAAALAEERTGRLVEQALESRLAADTTDRVLHGPELENAVEVIAASPAVRAALAQQTTSLAGEVAARVRSRALDLDDASERTARRWLRRAPRDEPAASGGRVPYAGLVTRGAALALDAAIVNAIVLVVAALLGLIASLVGELRPEWLALTLAACGWALAVGTYFVLFWSTAGQTPAMRILRLRVTGRRRPTAAARQIDAATRRSRSGNRSPVRRLSPGSVRASPSGAARFLRRDGRPLRRRGLTFCADLRLRLRLT